jgi:fido (protein-threonine AMPylation protein)
MVLQGIENKSTPTREAVTPPLNNGTATPILNLFSNTSALGPRHAISPFLQAVFSKSSPLHAPSAQVTLPSSTVTGSPTSAQQSSNSRERDPEEDFSEEIGNALCHLKDLELLDLNTITKDLNAVEEKIKNFEAKIAKSNIISSHHKKQSKLWGWGTVIGITSLGIVVTAKAYKRLSLSTFTTLCTSLTIMTGICGSQAITAEKNRSNADMDSALFEQFLPTLQNRQAERQNTKAVKLFYSDLKSPQSLISGTHFSEKSHLFTTQFHLNQEQKQQIALMHNKLQNLHSFPTEISTELAEEVATLTIYHSNRIENAGLDIRDTNLVIKGTFCPGESPTKRFLETWTHGNTLAIVIEYLRTGLTRHHLRPSHMKELHKCLMAEEPVFLPGNYRRDNAFVSTNPSQVLACPLEINSLVEKVFRYINETEDHEIEILINVHMWLVRIHPFADGNGRVIRLIMTFLALNAGYTTIALTGALEEYFRSIRCWDESPEIFGGIIVREMLRMTDVYDKAGERAQKRRA